MRIFHDRKIIATFLKAPVLKPSERRAYEDAVDLMHSTQEIIERAIGLDNESGMDTHPGEGDVHLKNGDGFISVLGVLPETVPGSERPRASEATLVSKGEDTDITITFDRSGSQDVYRAVTDSPKSYLTETVFYDPTTDKVIYNAEETFRYPKTPQ